MKNSRRPGACRASDVTVRVVLAAGVAGLTMVSGCALADMSRAELQPLKRPVIQEICAGQTAKANPGDARLLARQSPEALQRASQEWGVDLTSWLAGHPAVGTSPACRDARSGPARPPVGQAGSRR
jgi:hypothetical protein